jgi:hypothetical protein
MRILVYEYTGPSNWVLELPADGGTDLSRSMSKVLLPGTANRQ